ncbi:YnbE family lipoprotein [Phenylobacterium sp. J367]|uniref:YnbE family lipoprotein n=1 Tax=Phenylobacterium sp. J367 TaxID=2898435 RepID=UPI0021511EF5|nr:YnbE family lipoprotein [Phenylobacterium sp. J367]MCR5877897.1 YnbE family lipoprotein [Phenylobacterium sp. J367]
MISKPRSLAVAAGAIVLGGLGLAACTPTVRVQVEPITIYAKLDADVRLRLDEEVKALIQKNPNLF